MSRGRRKSGSAGEGDRRGPDARKGSSGSGSERGWLYRSFWTAVVFGGAVAIVATLWIGVPVAFFHLGIGARYEVSLLRWGVAEYSRSLDITPESLQDATYQRRWPIGYAFAREGDTLRIAYRAAPVRGSATLIFEGIVGAFDRVWRRRFEAADPDDPSGEDGTLPGGEDAGTVRVEVPETGLYAVRYQMTDFLGDLEVRWRVE